MITTVLRAGGSYTMNNLKITSQDYYRHRFASAFFSTLTSSSC